MRTAILGAAYNTVASTINVASSVQPGVTRICWVLTSRRVTNRIGTLCFHFHSDTVHVRGSAWLQITCITLTACTRAAFLSVFSFRTALDSAWSRMTDTRTSSLPPWRNTAAPFGGLGGTGTIGANMRFGHTHASAAVLSVLLVRCTACGCASFVV